MYTYIASHRTKYFDKTGPVSAFLVSFFCTALFGIMASAPAQAREFVTITTEKETRKAYLELISHCDNDPAKITRIPPGKYNRTVVELAIIAKALRLGGLTASLRFCITPNASREIEEVVQGRAVICSQQLNKGTLTHTGFAQALYTSDPITRFGEFQKGIYCLPSNVRVLSVKTKGQLKSAGKGVIGMDWDNDKRVLKGMDIDNYITAPTTPLLMKMLISGRAAWTPLSIPNTADMSRTFEGHRLIPVPGIKVSLLESRHFFVSKRHPMGKQVFKALEKGLKILRKKGFIKDSLTAAGFLSPRTEGWTILNADQIEKGPKAYEEEVWSQAPPHTAHRDL